RPDDGRDVARQHLPRLPPAPRRGMTNQKSLDYLTSLGRFGIKLGPERTEALLHRLCDPQDLFQGVLTAGTNGKGSVCAMGGRVLQASGYRVGLMAKPPPIPL